ncbi:MAG: T9SS type A sorting domain-containing protein [Chitinophagaceae bacterium]
MKRNSTLKFYFIIVSILVFSTTGFSQCPGGYTQAQLNWDHIDFLPSNNVRYSSFYPSAAFPYNQNFTIGTRTVNFTMAPAANIALDGENATHTGHAGSSATAGDDVQFTTTSTANTTITTTFDADVANVRFPIFDLDFNQRVNITATNALGVAQTIIIGNAIGTSGITFAGSGTTSATATAPAINYGINNQQGTVNVTVAGPVKQIIIRFNTAVGDIWLGDIDACVTGAFPNNYQQISRPFTGQPQYVLSVVNNNIYYVDPSNGKGYFLFNEPAHNRLNSMAYDPYKRVVYYTFSLTGGSIPQTDKVLKKYDVDTKLISVVIPDVNTFGIPTYESGVESGAATFYNGALYLGIEGYTGTSGGGSYAAARKSTIWKINFDAAGNAVPPAAQVWGVTADDGVNAQNIHDWSDFAISNGTLYDFDGSQSGGTDFYQFNLMTGNRVRYAPTVVPKQVSIGWDETIYNVDFTIARYNGTTGMVAGTTFTIAAPIGPTIPTGAAASWGDAAGPYRPFLDFGDAPATYDPNPLSPACHDTLTPTVAGRRTKMQLGPNEDVEWLKKGFTTVEDNYEDALPFVPIFSPPTGNYVAPITVLNNTGANATVCAWLDFNGNGLFDPSEAVTPITVPSSALVQPIALSWSGISSSLPNGTFTYLRIRITDQASGMTINNATGYYNIGEVEDYRIVIDYFPLAINLMSFDAQADNSSKVKLNWTASENENFPGYEVQRSANGTDWEFVDFLPALKTDGINKYQLTDNNPHKGTSYYRLKFNETGKLNSYSNIETARIADLSASLNLFPNPAIDKASVIIASRVNGQTAQVRIINVQGKRLTSQKVTLVRGNNSLNLPIQASWPPGMYIVQVVTGEETINKKLVLQR